MESLVKNMEARLQHAEGQVEALYTENADLKKDLEIAAEIGQQLIEENKQLEEFRVLYQRLKRDYDNKCQEVYRLEVKLNNQEAEQNDAEEIHKSQIFTLVRESTKDKLKSDELKRMQRDQINILETELKLERSKSSITLGNMPKRNTQLKMPKQKRQIQNVGSVSQSANTSSCENSEISIEDNSRSDDDQGHTAKRATSTVDVRIKPVKSKSELYKKSKNNKSKASNIEQLIQMASQVDDNFQQRAFELEREKNRTYISQLEQENRQLRRKISELNEEIGTYQLYVKMRDEEDQQMKEASLKPVMEEDEDLPLNLNFASARSLQDELKLAQDGGELRNGSEVRLLTSAIVQSQDIINCCIQQTDEIRDQLEAAHGIVKDILDRNHLKLEHKVLSAQESSITDEISVDIDTADSQNTRNTNSLDKDYDFSLNGQTEDLIAALILLKQVDFRNHKNISSCSSGDETERNMRGLDSGESLHARAELASIRETLTRVKTELNITQEQLMNTIQQKVKMQLEIEEWHEDMAAMVCQNVALSSWKAQHSQTRDMSQAQRKLRLSEWLRQKVHGLYLT